jgi:S-adenosyl-L-methionine hydrolase (adenosine-forming)
MITLTTDFGEASPYVAAMKGVILATNPEARLLDLTHQVPPQDVRHAAHYLASAIPYFPGNALHVVVVDPGVGTERRILYVELGGHRLLVPNNGCWTEFARRVAQPTTVICLAEPRYWRQPVSTTFHGRDIFAPVAGHLSKGLDPRLLGPPVSSWVTLKMPVPRTAPDGVHGEVVFVDDFGNLITNLPQNLLPDSPVVRVGDVEVPRWVRAYGDATPGELVALVSSNGTLEIAVVQGSAAKRLNAGVGTLVLVTARPKAPGLQPLGLKEW